MSFYTSVFSRSGKICARGWENGTRFHREIPFRPSLYIPRSGNQPASGWKTLHGHDVVEVPFDSIRSAEEFAEKYKDVSNFKVYGNTNWPAQYISANYPEQVEYNLDEIRVGDIDIETECDNGFSDATKADNEILLITLGFRGQKYSFGLEARGTYTPHEPNIHYTACMSESELLYKFLARWEECDLDVVTGWNVKWYDIPYVVRRISKVLGDQYVKRLSPWNWVRENERDGEISFEITGITTLDYKQLYQFFIPNKQVSYALAYIAKKELGDSKVGYDEYDNIAQFYQKNWQKFVEYNIKDVQLVDDLDKKLGFIGLAVSLAYAAKVNFADVFMQVRMWDGFSYHALQKKKIVFPPNAHHPKNDQFEGAFVKDPQIGRHKWIVSLDVNSMYPNIISQYNLSPETIVAESDVPIEFKHLLGKNLVDDIVNERIDTSGIAKHGMCISANGQFFRTDVRGFLPELMDQYYAERMKFKEEAGKAKKLLKELEEELKVRELPKYKHLSDDELRAEIQKTKTRYAQLDNCQKVRKVSINSAFGVIGSNYFRFYDLRISEAITVCGQATIQYLARKINALLNKTLKTDKDFCIASDTDSLYLGMEDLVNHVFGDKPKTDEEVVKFLDNSVKSIILPMISKELNNLCVRAGCQKLKLKMGREVIAVSGVWTAKKRYALLIADSEGVPQKPYSTKIMGLETARSSTPDVVRDYLSDALKIVLGGTQDELCEFVEKCRTEFRKSPPEKVAFPRGCNGLTKYASSSTIYVKGTPIQVRASLVYNHFIKQLKLSNQYELIREGEKVKFIYLTLPNTVDEDVIAFPHRLPVEFGLTKYIDWQTQFQKTFLDPLESVTQAVGWNSVLDGGASLF